MKLCHHFHILFQRIIRAYISFCQNLIVISPTGPTSLFQKDEICFYQYLEYLMTNLEDMDSVERFAKGYEDYLQAPLQPLMDNLESQVCWSRACDLDMHWSSGSSI